MSAVGTLPAPQTCRTRRAIYRLAASSRLHTRASRLRCTAAATDAAAEKKKQAVSFPFVKIVGQEDMKLALQLNVVDPRIGGVLIMGDRGTGKSVAVRALVDLLPEMDVVAGDSYNSSPTDPQLMGPEAREKHAKGLALPAAKKRIPMIEVPLGATEDRICGTIDIERALSEGVKAFEPGLLAKANRGILFVDEVNLLDDSLVDVILDSAAGGWNTVEREGISVIHPAKFIMIGSGNQEEGEMRPQLLDRFGMAVTVTTMYDKDARVALVQNRLAFEADADAFIASCQSETDALRAKLDAARKRVNDVTINRELTLKISEVCSGLNVDGLRGDITVNRAAKAMAALEGVNEATQKHVERVIGLCLAHRLRKDPLDGMDNGGKVKLAYARVFLKEERAAAMAVAQAAKPAAKPAVAPAPSGGAKPGAEAPQGGAAAPAPEKKKAGAWSGLPFGR